MSFALTLKQTPISVSAPRAWRKAPKSSDFATNCKSEIGFNDSGGDFVPRFWWRATLVAPVAFMKSQSVESTPVLGIATFTCFVLLNA